MRPSRGSWYKECSGDSGDHNHYDGCDGTKESICRQRHAQRRAARMKGVDGKTLQANNDALLAASTLKKLSKGAYKPENAHAWGKMRKFIEQEMQSA